MNVNELIKIKNKLEKRKNELAEKKGEEKSLLNRLQEDFGVSYVQGRKKIKSLAKQIETAKKDYNKAVDAFEDKYGDILETL